MAAGLDGEEGDNSAGAGGREGDGVGGGGEGVDAQ